MSCGVDYRRGSDPGLLWLWRRSAAVVLIQPLAWEPPCASGVALKRKKKISQVPTVAQEDWWRLGSARSQVQSPTGTVG